MNNDSISTFALFGLCRALIDFGCGPFEMDKHITWYWRNVWTWPAQESQEDFNKLARHRISDRVGYTRRRADAWGVIDRLFDKGRETGVTYAEVIKAVTFLCPTQEMPFLVHENGKVALVDMTKRADSPKILVVDASFLPTLRALYPFERTDDVVHKVIPLGTTFRELNLVTLPFWKLYPDAEWEERRTAVEFGRGGRLDWTQENLSSRWRGANLERHRGKFWKTPMEKQWHDGTTVLYDSPGNSVLTGWDLKNVWNGSDNAPTPHARPTPTGELLNKAKQDEYEASK